MPLRAVIRSVCFAGMCLARVWGQACPPPPAMAASTEFNLFTPEREADLGDAIAEHVQRTIPIVHARAQTAYLEALGARLLAHMPPTAIRFRYFLVDIGTPNAFVLPGGRVYISRKLVAFVKSEDELAGILGHEFGHVLARQGSRRISRVLRSGLGVQSISDRADVFALYNQMLDGSSRAELPPKYVDDEVAADQLSLYALAAAGYDPAAMVAFFDRLTENNGATGGAMSDFLTLTRPESKRVREMARSLAAMPASCRDTASRSTAEAFETWRQSVAELSGVRAVASVAPVRTLTPRLRPELRFVTFSPDGKWLAAQDESGIVLLGTNPLAVRLHIGAPTNQRAVFSADSRTLHLLTLTHRLEIWDVQSATRLSVREVVSGTTGCAEALLAPGGRALACRTKENAVRLYDAATDALIASREFEVDDGARTPQLTFSPDGRYFMTSPRKDTSPDGPWAYDLERRANVAIPGSLRGLLAGGFAFAGADRVAAMRANTPARSGLFTWPGGELVQPLSLPAGSIEGVTKGPYLVVHPYKDSPSALLDLRDGSLTPSSAAVDVFDTWIAGERDTGGLGLQTMGKEEEGVGAPLPDAALFEVRAAAISEDLNRIALSNTSRTGVWTLNGSQPTAMLPPATSARFREDGRLQVNAPGRIQVVEWPSARVADDWKLPEGERHLLRGPVLYQLIATGEGDRQKDSIVVRDTATRAVLWKTTLPPDAAETFTGDEVVVTIFPVESKTARLVLRTAAMRERLFEGRKPAGRILRLLGARDGKELGWIAIEEPAVHPQRIRVHGDTVFVGDAENRVHVYVLGRGQSMGRVFGKLIAASADGKLMCVENEPGDIRVHETARMTERGRWQLDGNTLAGRFDATGGRLLVVSSTQNVFVLPVSQKQ